MKISSLLWKQFVQFLKLDLYLFSGVNTCQYNNNFFEETCEFTNHCKEMIVKLDKKIIFSDLQPYSNWYNRDIVSFFKTCVKQFEYHFDPPSDFSLDFFPPFSKNIQKQSQVFIKIQKINKEKFDFLTNISNYFFHLRERVFGCEVKDEAANEKHVQLPIDERTSHDMTCSVGRNEFEDLNGKLTNF